MVRQLLVLVMVAALTACNGSGGSQGDTPNATEPARTGPLSSESSSTSVPFATVDRTQNSQVTVPRLLAVTNASDWAALWQQHAPGRGAPVVDFAREMVIGVFAGEQPDLCRHAEITSVQSAADHRLVHYRYTVPEPTAICAQAIAYPAHLIRLEASALPTLFVRDADSASR